MIDERQEELAALHALDLLEGGELAQFNAALERDPALRSLARELRESAAALAHTVAAPPPAALKARVLASIEARNASGPATAPDNVIRPRFAFFGPLAAWATAACLAIAAGWLAQRYWTARTESSLLRDQQTLANFALQNARNQLEAERILAQRQITDLNQEVAAINGHLAAVQLAATEAERQRLLAERDGLTSRQQLLETSARLAVVEQRLAAANARIAGLTQELKAQGDLATYKITTLASMLNNSPEALAVAVWNPAKQEGVLQVEKLPALAANKDYQLWVIDPQYGAPVDAGVFTVDAQTGAARVRFKSKQPVKVINAFAVTLERKGGVPKAEGPFMLMSK